MQTGVLDIDDVIALEGCPTAHTLSPRLQPFSGASRRMPERFGEMLFDDKNLFLR